MKVSLKMCYVMNQGFMKSEEANNVLKLLLKML